MNLSLLNLEIATCVLAMLVLMHDAFRKDKDKTLVGAIAAAGMFLILAWSCFGGAVVGEGFNGMWINDGVALFFKRLFLISTILVLIMSIAFAKKLESGVGEFFALILFACTGMLLTASSNDFIMLFVSLETVTVSFYILTSYLRRQLPSLEAGVKYLVLSAVASAFLVYGITFIYGTTGTTGFAGIAKYAAENVGSVPLTLGLLLVIAGLGFKCASVPFQIWVPDVYQGAPTPVTAFLAVGSKAAGFVMLLRVLQSGLLPLKGTWVLVIGVLAGLTILYGNLAALPQKNIKRLLGYSSISHAGFLLLGVSAASTLGTSAVLFYLFAYVFTNLAAFMVIVCMAHAIPDDEMSNYAGLAKRSPLLAAAMTVSMVSLAGIPPLAGFFAKLLIFTAILDKHMWCLAAIGALGVVASLYYYLGVVRAMYWSEPRETSAIAVSLPMKASLLFAMAAIFIIGIWQGPFTTWAYSAAATLVK
jgi:NADH-quinone oxidoreductase subunit N